MLISVLVGLVVSAVASAAAYQTYIGSAISFPQTATLHYIAATAEAVEAYRAAHHALPTELKGLQPSGIRRDEHDAPADWWHRPLQYWTDGTHYRITSYGYDGEPGGVGLDRDLASDDSGKDGRLWPKPPPEAAPTFWQFATDWTRLAIPGSSLHGSGAMMLLPWVLAGVLSFALSYRTLGSTTGAHEGPRQFVAALATTIIATVFVAFVMTMLEIPSGH